MIRATQVALLAFLIVATLAVAAVGWASFSFVSGLNARLDAETGILARAEGLETKANATLINLDKGTAVWAASAKDQAGAIQDLATDAHGTLSQANLALESIPPVSAELTSELAALHKTTDAATDSAHALALALGTANDTIGQARPLIASYAQAGQDLDALLKDQAIHQTLANVQDVTGSGAAILADARKVADKETADWLKPVPWWKQPIKRAGDLIDIGAAIARHTP